MCDKTRTMYKTRSFSVVVRVKGHLQVVHLGPLRLFGKRHCEYPEGDPYIRPAVLRLKGLLLRPCANPKKKAYLETSWYCKNCHLVQAKERAANCCMNPLIVPAKIKWVKAISCEHCPYKGSIELVSKAEYERVLSKVREVLPDVQPKDILWQTLDVEEAHKS